MTHEQFAAMGPYRDLVIQGDETAIALSLHRFMLRLRLCEEALSREYHPADEMRCPVHFCVGQEAAPAAVAELIREEDYLFSHHRSHGYYLAKGAPMKELFAELYGKRTGANSGLAGSQDISSPRHRFFSGAILAGATAISMGAALALQLQRTDSVVVAAFGEAATDEGIFWETVNYAALCKLPVVFVCENNKYSVFSPLLKRTRFDNLADRVGAFGMRHTRIFGNDAMLVYRSLREAVAKARGGEGPTFIESFTYRWSGHYGPAPDDPVGYRPAGEMDAWKANCPIKLLEEKLVAAGALSPSARQGWAQQCEAEISDSFRFAKESPFPELPDWRSLNLASATPEADRLLADWELADFDAEQKPAQPKGY